MSKKSMLIMFGIGLFWGSAFYDYGWRAWPVLLAPWPIAVSDD